MFDQLVVSGEMEKTHKPWAVDSVSDRPGL